VLSSAAAASCLSAFVSHHNYPGGIAMTKLHELHASEANVTRNVHLDAFTAMTGASLFTHQFTPTWNYNKSETLSSPLNFDSFDYVLTNSPSLHGDLFETEEVVSAFGGLRRNRQRSEGEEGDAKPRSLFDAVRSIVPVTIHWEERVWIMKRKARDSGFVRDESDHVFDVVP
jgi:hypothetical protein